MIRASSTISFITTNLQQPSSFMRIKLSLLGLLTAATALAQTTYKPKLIQGLVKEYNQDITLKVSNPNQNYSATIHVEDQYEVTSVSKDSVIINYMVTKIDTQGSKAAEESANASFGLMLNKPLKASYNPDGSFRHLLNADELISGTSGNAKILAEQIFTDNAYAIKQKSSLMWMLMGRTINTGMTEDFLDENINMKREFTVSPDGRQVDVKIASNMSEEETKKFLKAMLEKAGEEVAGQSEEIFNTLKSMGMADINSTGAAHIYVGDDDWVKSGESTLKMKMMGNDMETTIKYTPKQ